MLSKVSYVKEFFKRNERDDSIYPMTSGDERFTFSGCVAMRWFKPHHRPARALLRVAKGRRSGYHVAIVTSPGRDARWELTRLGETATWLDALTACEMACDALDELGPSRTLDTAEVRDAVAELRVMQKPASTALTPHPDILPD